MNTHDISRAPTDRSPEIQFDPDACSLSISGASFPEDGAAFYGPVLSTLDDILKALDQRCVTVRIALNYFNSSSAKALMNLFLMLDDAAQAGNQVVVNWFHAADDDTMKEFGEEFAEDVRFVRFNVIPTAATS